jgi:hypothetical protein
MVAVGQGSGFIRDKNGHVDINYHSYHAHMSREHEVLCGAR